MKKELKILGKGESTYRNGAGSMCGGVMSKTAFFEDVEAHMMAYYMEDDKFEEYKKLKTEDKSKEASKLFDKHARSFI